MARAATRPAATRPRPIRSWVWRVPAGGAGRGVGLGDPRGAALALALAFPTGFVTGLVAVPRFVALAAAGFFLAGDGDRLRFGVALEATVAPTLTAATLPTAFLGRGYLEVSTLGPVRAGLPSSGSRVTPMRRNRSAAAAENIRTDA